MSDQSYEASVIVSVEIRQSGTWSSATTLEQVDNDAR